MQALLRSLAVSVVSQQAGPSPLHYSTQHRHKIFRQQLPGATATATAVGWLCLLTLHPHMLSFRVCRPAFAASAPRNPHSTGFTHQHRHLQPRTMSTAAASTAEQADTSAVQPAADPIVQWVVLRRDLWQDLGWPLGAVVAQACHASTAAVSSHLSDDLTQEYIHADNIDHMHKVGRGLSGAHSGSPIINYGCMLRSCQCSHQLALRQRLSYNFPCPCQQRSNSLTAPMPAVARARAASTLPHTSHACSECINQAIALAAAGMLNSWTSV
jgi:hypothetical protein